MHGFGVDGDKTVWEKDGVTGLTVGKVGIRAGGRGLPILALENHDVGTATAAAEAATLNKQQGVITSEALTTAQNAFYTLTLTNARVAATSIVQASVWNGTNTQGTPMVEKCTPGAGSAVIRIVNKHATAEALNGTIKIGFVVHNGV